MKISMWMIANRLLPLDPEIHIHDDAPVSLRSARRAYATNCVFVYQSGKDVFCRDDLGNYIILKDMAINQAFEIIQCVFDFYDDWDNELQEAISSQDFHQAIDISWMVFHNPLILFDGNCKVIALSSQYADDDLDAEWNYLCKYGYSSVSAMDFLRYECVEKDFSATDIQKYSFQNGILKMSGMSATLYWQQSLCGRINLLESDRDLNLGDYQLLTHLIKYLAPVIGQRSSANDTTSTHNIFFELVQGHQFDKEVLEIQLKYQNWQEEDIYQVSILEGCTATYSLNSLEVICHVIRNTIPGCITLIQDHHAVIISNLHFIKGNELLNRLKPIAASNDCFLALSLPYPEISHISYLYQQALSAFDYGKLLSKNEQVFYFYDYAVDYIVESPDLIHSFHACSPDLMIIWNMENRHMDGDLYLTLKTFLEQERSVVATAQAMFVHRNTIQYRIKKITDILHHSLSDSYVRDYIQLSLKVMEIFSCRYPDSEEIQPR